MQSNGLQSKAFQWQFVTFFRILFAAHLLYSGGAYIFFGWIPSAYYNPASPVGQFMVELDRIGLYPLVKYVEFGLGLLALTDRFTPLAAVMEFPINLMIAYLNLVVEGPLESRHYYTGTQELLINGMVLLGYGAYYRPMLGMHNRPQWLWQKTPAPDAENAAALPASDAAASPAGSLGTPQMWLFFIAFMVVVMAASWLLGSSARRLPPRDWLPPLLAFVTMLALWRFNQPRTATHREMTA